MIIKIMSFYEASDHLWAKGNDHYDHIISIDNHPTSPLKDFPPKGLLDQKGRVLRLEFDDVQTPGGASEKAGYIPPAKDHVQSIIDFSHDIEEGNRVLVHCHAGISRSSAAALIVFFMKHKNEEEAILKMYMARRKEIRPELYPNRIMVKHADNILGSNLTKVLNSSLIDILKKA